MAKKKANLFVIGAMRAGTTSFMEVLQQRSEIYVSPIKEPHYFVDSLPKQVYNPSRFFSLETYFKNKVLEKLHIAKVENNVQYQQLFSGAQNEIYRAEGSTCYLTAPEAALKIHRYNPEAKIIIITRSPIVRAFSQYTMNKGLGRTTATFDDVLQKNLQEYKKGTLHWSSYLEMSNYTKNSKRFKNLFSEVLVVPFEHLYDQTSAWTEVWKFLNIPDSSLDSIPRKNAGRNILAQPLYAKLHGTIIKAYFSKFVGDSLKASLFKSISTPTVPYMELSQETLQQLDFFFKEQENHAYDKL